MDDQANGDASERLPRKPGRLAAPGNKQPLNLRMDAGVIHCLKRHALDKGRTVSDVVTELVLAHLRDGDARSETTDSQPIITASTT